MDHSEMSTLLTCARKHQLQYEVGVAEDGESPALNFGTGWHWVMEAHGNQSIAFVNGVSKFDPSLAELVLTTKGWRDIPNDFRTGSKLVRGYERWMEVQGHRYTFLHVEGGFSVDVGETEDMTGRVDAHVLYDAGYGYGREEYLVDYKTTSRLDGDWIEQYTMSNQFRMYYIAKKKQYPNLAGVIIDVFHATKGNKSAKEADEQEGVRFYNLVLRYDDADLLETKADFSAALGLKKRYKEMGYAPRNTAACRMYNRTCGFIEVCGASDPEVRKAVLDNLPKHTFNPLEGM